MANQDDWMIGAISDAQRERQWGNNEELLAVIAETLHALLLVTVRIHSRKGVQLPKPLRIRRPYQQDETPAMTMGEMARRMVRR